MSDSISVFAPGSVVEIHAGKEPVIGTVCEISIADGGRVQYRVAWWNGRTRVVDWLESLEVTWIEGAKRQDIGFRSNQ